MAQNTAALDQGKAALHAAIVDEVHRKLAPLLLAGVERPVELELTWRMAVPIVALYRYGREEPLRVMARMGLTPKAAAVRYAEVDPRQVPVAIRPTLLRLEADLTKLAGTITSELGVAREAGPLEQLPALQLRRLASVPGALAAASYLVIPPYNAGQSDIYRANADLFGGWVYSAAGDSHTCDPCDSKDGTEYRSLEDAAKDGMDGFGPNPLCEGRTRCRCTLLPLP